MVYCLPHLLDRAADRSPDQDAYRCQDRKLTFANLCRSANQLARLLVDQGVRRGDLVGVYMPRCLESAVAVYGILKAGAAFVPIDPQMPPAGVATRIAECRVRHVVAHRGTEAGLKRLGPVPIEAAIGVSPDADVALRSFPWETLDQLPTEPPPEVRLLEQDLAYIIFTSGSTGRSKGIMHTHHSGLSYAALSGETYGLGPADVIGNPSPLHFDMSTFGFLSAPYAGATTVLIPEAYTKLPASLSQLIEAERLTIWYSVPYALIQLLLRGGIDQRDFSSLRWVLFGGEPFPPKYLQTLRSLWGQSWFSNVYGPAEVNQCTYYHLPPWDDSPAVLDSEQSIPIGKAWDNTECLVIDGDGRRVEVGQVGELVIRSPTMMSGYWARPDLNAAAFYREAGNLERVYYRSGDLVELRGDGNFVFLGRQDRQVKVRGHRVELDDIEHVLASHQEVEEAAVFPVDDGQGSFAVEAAVTLRSDAAAAANDLIRYLADRLPSFAVPANLEILDSFPRTTSGKIDRRELGVRAETP